MNTTMAIDCFDSYYLQCIYKYIYIYLYIYIFMALLCLLLHLHANTTAALHVRIHALHKSMPCAIHSVQSTVCVSKLKIVVKNVDPYFVQHNSQISQIQTLSQHYTYSMYLQHISDMYIYVYYVIRQK